MIRRYVLAFDHAQALRLGRVYSDSPGLYYKTRQAVVSAAKYITRDRLFPFAIDGIVTEDGAFLPIRALHVCRVRAISA